MLEFLKKIMGAGNDAQLKKLEKPVRAVMALELDSVPCRDFSPLAAVPRYRSLNLYNLDSALWLDTVGGLEIETFACGNTGLDGTALKKLLEEHPGLRNLNLSWNRKLTDLTPLLELDALEEVRVSRDMQAAVNSLNGKEYAFRLNIEG